MLFQINKKQTNKKNVKNSLKKVFLCIVSSGVFNEEFILYKNYNNTVFLLDYIPSFYFRLIRGTK